MLQDKNTHTQHMQFHLTYYKHVVQLHAGTRPPPACKAYNMLQALRQAAAPKIALPCPHNPHCLRSPLSMHTFSMHQALRQATHATKALPCPHHPLQPTLTAKHAQLQHAPSSPAAAHMLSCGTCSHKPHVYLHNSQHAQPTARSKHSQQQPACIANNMQDMS